MTKMIWLTCILTGLILSVAPDVSAQQPYPFAAWYDSASRMENRSLLRAEEMAHALIDHAVRENNLRWQMRGQFLLADVVHKQERGADAMHCLALAEGIASTLDSPLMKIDILIKRGYVYKNIFRKPDSAAYAFEAARDQSVRYGYPSGQVRSTMALAYLRMDRAQFIEAMDLLMDVRRTMSRLQNSPLRINLLNSIGHTYMEVGMLPEALSFFSESVREASRLRLPELQMLSQINLAEAYLKSGNADTAYAILSLNNPLMEQFPNIQMSHSHYDILGEIYLAKHAYREACLTFEKIASKEAGKPLVRNFTSLTKKARALMGLRDTLAAHEAALAAMALSEKGGNNFPVSSMLPCYEILAQTYATRKDYRKALEYSRRSGVAYREIYNQKTRSEIIRNEIGQRMRAQQQQDALEKQLLAKQHRISQQQLYILASLMTLMALAVGFIAYRFVQKNRMAALLEKMVAERTEEIRLKNEMLEEYAFINAHQLRAPIARLLGLCDIFSLARTTEEKEALINMINHEAADLDAIVWAIRDAISGGEPLDRWDLQKYSDSRPKTGE